MNMNGYNRYRVAPDDLEIDPEAQRIMDEAKTPEEAVEKLIAAGFSPSSSRALVDLMQFLKGLV